MVPATPKVLVVDDNDANLVALAAVLERLPCEVVLARSGEDALRCMLKDAFAVVLLDVHMNGMDGYEVAKIARSTRSTSEVPIVFVTAMHATEDSALRGYGAGAVDFLFKPINAEILTSKVRVFLELWSSRQRLAEEIEAHQETLADLEAFNFSVSHDLRAPLRPLAGFSSFLLEDYADKLDAQGRDYLERIRAAVTRMNQLIDDMLMFSRTTREKVERSTVDLAAIARDVIEDLRRAEPNRAVELQAVAEARVQGDARLLRIALENLLRNAWKFSRDAAPARIELGKQPRGADGTVYFVRDNGAGFDARYASRLFQPFQRLHSTAEFEGTGIGLATVQRVIRRHGGRIWAESSPGKGATFFFQLP